ncbi:MAG: sulfite exporter TauE/SafE family protein [Haloglomus sp.]
MADLWLLPILGLFIGATVTLLGGGGGVFYFLTLVTLVGLPYRVAVPTSLATVVLTTAFGSYGHYREGNVAVRIGALVVSGAVVGTYLGTRAVGSLPTSLLRRALGGFLLALAVATLVVDRYRPSPRDAAGTRTTSVALGPVRAGGAVALGVLTGALSALFGISGTPVLLPGLFALGLPATAVVGTSVFAVLGVAVAGVGWYAGLGALDPVVAAAFGLGAAGGGVLAPRLLAGAPTDRLEALSGPVFAGLSALAGVGFLAGLL